MLLALDLELRVLLFLRLLLLLLILVVKRVNFSSYVCCSIFGLFTIIVFIFIFIILMVFLVFIIRVHTFVYRIGILFLGWLVDSRVILDQMGKVLPLPFLLLLSLILVTLVLYIHGSSCFGRLLLSKIIKKTSRRKLLFLVFPFQRRILFPILFLPRLLLLQKQKRVSRQQLLRILTRTRRLIISKKPNVQFDNFLDHLLHYSHTLRIPMIRVRNLPRNRLQHIIHQIRTMLQLRMYVLLQRLIDLNKSICKMFMRGWRTKLRLKML